jgi:hypothetical protein
LPPELRSSGFEPFAHQGQVVGDSVVWQRAGGYWGYFAVYGPAREAARTCVLKLPAGSAGFDPGYSSICVS